eukprot:10019880-Karenia_brevis.AAC.1
MKGMTDRCAAECGAPSAKQRKLQKVFDLMLEIGSDNPTHFDHSGMRETKIDRLFISLPSWM